MAKDHSPLRHRRVLLPRTKMERIEFLSTSDLADANLSPRELLRVRSLRMEQDRLHASMKVTVREIEEIDKKLMLGLASAKRTPSG